MKLQQNINRVGRWSVRTKTAYILTHKAMKREKFVFKYEWMVIAQTLRTPQERVNFFNAIVNYGLENELPDNLKGRACDYFYNRVKPEIDRRDR